MRIVCIGDSLTYGYGVRRAVVWTALALREMSGIEIINRGMNGDTTGGMLARFDADVAENAPDVAFLMGGNNDIFFSRDTKTAKGNMAAMIFRCMHCHILPVVGIPLPVFYEGLSKKWRPFASGKEVEELLLEYREWLMEFAHNFQVQIVDFRECVPEEMLKRKEFYLDGIHACEEGHRRMAEVWIKNMAKFII